MPESKAAPPVLTLIGAGLVGSLLANILARRGHSVELYERRPDMRRETIAAGRSINLAVSVRGLYALRQVGLEEEVLAQAIAMRGRMMHSPDGALTFQRYGKDDSECIHSISRGTLNRLLMTSAEKAGKVRIHFGKRLTAANLSERRLEIRDEESGKVESVSAPIVIGTDGSASAIRDAVVSARGAECTEVKLAHGYKELTIPSGPGGTFLLEKHALHIWPRGTYMLIALPNLDGSFTCTLFLPLEGDVSFERLRTPGDVRALFAKQFPDAAALIPDLETTFFENPTGHMVTVKSAAWSLDARALLVGDAAHAIVPFFGQGMNCGFEDCTAIAGLLDGGAEFAEIFARFETERKTNADAIADMAVENFVEMRDKVGQPDFLREKAVEGILQKRFPGVYVSRYSLVSFSREPYRFAYEMGRIQTGILAELCHGLARAEDVDLAKADRLIETKLLPFLKTLTQGAEHGSETKR